MLKQCSGQRSEEIKYIAWWTVLNEILDNVVDSGQIQ